MQKILIASAAASMAAVLLYVAGHGEPPSLSPEWELVSDSTTATVYNATAGQCDGTPLITASNYHIVPERIGSERIVAMERTMMSSLGIAYGDFILVEGAGEYDGRWRVEDTMNKRFAGQDRIDFLVPSHVRKGKWKNVRIYREAKKRNP